MDLMAAASFSMAMSESSLQQQASISVVKKAMNMQEAQVAELLEMMPTPQSFGHQLDVYV